MRATVRNPCATVFPNGPSAAASGSTWIHWWSSVASAKVSTRFWSTVTQGLVPRSSPTAPRSSSTSANTRMGSSSRLALQVGGEFLGLPDQRHPLGGCAGERRDVDRGDAGGGEGLQPLGDVGARPDQRHRAHELLGHRRRGVVLLAVEVEVLDLLRLLLVAVA